VLLAVALPAPAAAGEEDARGVIEKAVGALGGGKKLARHKAMAARGAGTLYLAGRPVAATLRIVYQPPGQYVLAVECPVFRAATVLDGKRGWMKLGDRVTAMSRAQLAECKDNLHVEKVAALLPLLNDRAFTLTLLPDAYVNSAPAVGVKVSCKGRPDVKLYFDRKSSLLVKLQSAVKENRVVVQQEVLYGGYADVGGGTLRPHKVTTLRDGKPYSAWQITEHKLFEDRLRDIEFSRP
jgi:hypothetical protein